MKHLEIKHSLENEMKLNRYHFKVLTGTVLLIATLLFTCYSLINWRKEKENIDRFLPLLKADLKRTTEHPVVAAFQKKNSEQEGGLTLINYGEIFLKEQYLYSDIEEIFFRFLEKKDVICGNDVRLGSQHDGGWNVCMSPPFKLKKPCLVYSFGIGKDWRFEDDVYDYYGCKVLAFDPSTGMKQHNRTELMLFKPYGLGAVTETLSNGWRMKSFRQHIIDGGHMKSLIDYVKFDIENTEWEVLKSLTKDSILGYVKQLAFEIHLLPVPITKENDRSLTKQEFIEKFEILKTLESIGFKKFNYRVNPFCGFTSMHTGKVRSKCYELHYLNMDFVDVDHLEHVDPAEKLGLK